MVSLTLVFCMFVLNEECIGHVAELELEEFWTMEIYKIQYVSLNVIRFCYLNFKEL